MADSRRFKLIARENDKGEPDRLEADQAIGA